MNGFQQFGLSEAAMKALLKKGFEEPTEIQKLIIPAFLRGGKDLIGQAQTGTGKTAAFGIPLLELIPLHAKGVKAVVLTPTRELAIQVAVELKSLCGSRHISIGSIYGGQSYEQQFRLLKSGIDVMVGTPGRVIDHIDRGTLDISTISFFIIDEADEMLDLGFIDDIEHILKASNPDRRMLLFSATMPEKVMSIAREYMKDQEVIRTSKEHVYTELTEQLYFEVRETDKLEALCRIIDMEEEFYGLVFCRTKIDVDEMNQKLQARGYQADGLHGDISQTMRERILSRFRSGKIKILIATDVAARGIDIEGLTHVINFSLPQDPASYVHRIGRTGRAGRQGTAVTFITPDEYRKLAFIKKVSKADIRKKTVPRVKDVIEIKKARIRSDISEILAAGDYADYRSIAEDLLQEYPAQDVLAALFKLEYQDILDEKNYREIEDVSRSSSPDSKGKTRLLIGFGRNQGMSPKKLVHSIEKRSGVNQRFIHDVRVEKDYSLLTVSFKDAEAIYNAFGKRGLVTNAEKAYDKSGVPERGSRKKKMGTEAFGKKKRRSRS